MKRTSALKRTKPPARGKSKLSRTTKLRPVGKRGAKDREAIEAVRPVVLARAGNRCERCGERKPLELHHRLPRSRGGTHTAENLAALCATRDGQNGCHAKVTDHLVADWREWIVTRRGAA